MRRRQWITQFVALFLFIATSIGVVIFAEGYQYRRNEGLVKTSIIDFQFDLPGATLFLDGQPIQKKFPFSEKVDPGWHTVRIEKADFFPWEKQIYVDRDKVTLWKEFVLAPQRSENLFEEKFSFQGEILEFKEGRFALFDARIGALLFFDLNIARGSFLTRVINIPVPVKTFVAWNDDAALFLGKQKTYAVLDLDTLEIRKGKFSKDVSRWQDEPSLRDFSLQNTAPQNIPQNLKEGILIGESNQVLRAQKGWLVFSDEDGSNAHAIIPLDREFIIASEDRNVFAVFSEGQLKIFAPFMWEK